MTDSHSGRDGDEPQAPPQAGVLGNLPRSRPAVRSPRRPETPDPQADAARAAAASRPPKAEREPATPPEHGSEDPHGPHGPHGPQGPQGPGDLEGLARTGIAVATGAATLGLRIAGRAAAAVRDAVERR